MPAATTRASAPSADRGAASRCSSLFEAGACSSDSRQSSAALHRAAWGGKGRPFARAFAASIQKKDLRVDDAFREMRDMVNAETNGGQLPDVVQDDLPKGALILVGPP